VGGAGFGGLAVLTVVRGAGLVVALCVGFGVASGVGVASVVVVVSTGIVVGAMVVCELSGLVPPHPATSKAITKQEMFSKAAVPVLVVLMASFNLGEREAVPP